jgi:hypothetical protein
MTLISCCLIALCIAFAPSSYAQERATPLPDAQLSPVGRKARLALLSQISSKSPTGSSFMAKLEDPVEFDGKRCCPRGRWSRATSKQSPHAA